MNTYKVAAAALGAAIAVPDSRRYVHDVSDGIVRATYSFSTAIRVGARYFWVGIAHDEEDEYEAYKAAQSKVHAKAARAMMDVVKAHGGLYNKAAQYMSTQNHAMPAEFVAVLSEAQDKARSREFREIERAVKAELGEDAFGKKFVWFDPKPVAAASLAQVHRAVDTDGRECAVKVQYPGIDLQIMADVNTFRGLLQALEWVFDGFKMSWMLPQFKENLNWELDFAQDGRNGTRCGALLAHGASTGTAGRVVVPQVHWDLTTNRLLTMEWVSGAKATDKATLQALGISPADVASLVSRAFADMSLVHGLVHIDPHPGNLLVRRKPGAKPLPDDVQALLKTFPSAQDVQAMLQATGGNVAGMSFDAWAAAQQQGSHATPTRSGSTPLDTDYELEELEDSLPEGASLQERLQHTARHAKRAALNHVRITIAANAEHIDDAAYHWDACKSTAKRTAQALLALPLLCVMLPSVAAFGAIKAAIPTSVSKPVKVSFRSASQSAQETATSVLTAARDGYESLVGGATARKEREAVAAGGADAGDKGVKGGSDDTLATLRASTEAPTESFEEGGGAASGVRRALQPNSDWQLVLLDHGMYRRLDPGFRMANTALWKALATRDAALGTAAIIDMGIPAADAAKYFEIVCLLLTYRPSSASLGGRMTTSERAATRARFEKGGDLYMSGPEAVNDFIKSLPVDMLFTLRNTAIVRGVNRALGGTTLSRIQSMVEAIGDGYNVEHCTVDTSALSGAADTADGYDANGYKYLTPADISVLSAVHAGGKLNASSAEAAAASGAAAASEAAAASGAENSMVAVQHPKASINLATDTEMSLLRAAGALPAGAVRTSQVQGLVRAVQQRLAAEGTEVTQEVQDVLDSAHSSSMPAWLDSLVFGWYVWLFSSVLGVSGVGGGSSQSEPPKQETPATPPSVAPPAPAAPELSAAEQAALAAPEQLAAANRATEAALVKEREREARADVKKDDVYEKDFG